MSLSNSIKIIGILLIFLPIFFFSAGFLHNLNIVRMPTKGIYTIRLFVSLRTGVY